MIRALPAALLALLLLAPAAALAADEPRLRDAVTDGAGVLDGDEERAVEDALAVIRDRYDVQVFVAYIDTTLPDSVTDFASSTAAANSLGGNDVLFLVAFDDRSQSIWASDALDISDDEIDAALGVTESLLADGDYAGAAIAAGEALGEAAVSAPLTAPPATTVPATVAPATGVPGSGGTPEPEPTSGGGINLGAILAFLLIAGGLFLVGRTLLARRRAAMGPGVSRPPAEKDDLARQANRGLLATDEAVRDAEEEVGFAETQWGEAVAAPYREALAKARDELRAAFSVRQRIDDAVPETPEQRQAMLQEIVARTTAAGALLAAQATRLAELRDLERTAPEQLAALPAALQALHARHSAAAETLERLAGTYAPPALEPVTGNLVEADKALATAAAEGERGRALSEADRTGRTIALRHAQEAAASATRLIEAVERLATDLHAAAARLPQELAAAAADVATARDGLARTAALPPMTGPPGTGQGPPGGADPAAAVVDAERLLEDARRAAEARPLDPLDALERAMAANRAADAITAGLQVSEAQRQRRLQLAATAVTSARGRVDRAIDYIATRRHGVGRTARTRAAEAEASLADAARLAVTDPEAAVMAAQRATQLADEAYRLATSEFDAWDSGRGPVAGPHAPPAPPNPGADIAGAILGGIIGGVLAGGGRRGSGWGGSSWGGPMGGGRPGGGFGRPGPTGGGGGGGGGGRARGGRW